MGRRAEMDSGMNDRAVVPKLREIDTILEEAFRVPITTSMSRVSTALDSVITNLKCHSRKMGMRLRYQ